ncbi:hypothetical protein D1AOALGA4SA_11765 [Olavius algarvensis Delta 1 endosymbiont]|nr:hypothetical protein D1AOALGA4SA_11765 [Olavius algarvensis Delta 1 endosymbiont]
MLKIAFFWVIIPFLFVFGTPTRRRLQNRTRRGRKRLIF